MEVETILSTESPQLHQASQPIFLFNSLGHLNIGSNSPNDLTMHPLLHTKDNIGS